jgi:hypothetical protein
LYSRFHYILIALIIIVVYLIYLIGYYKVQEYETDTFMGSLTRANETAKERNREKEFLASYIRTPAYETQVAKATQNRKLPGETVINIVTEEEIASNADIDAQTVIVEGRTASEDPTRDMSNPEKWWWMMSGGRGR